MVGSLEAVLDRDIPRRQVDQTARNEERADPFWAFFLKQDRGVGDAGQTADAGADEHTGVDLLFARISFPAGVFQGLIGGGNRIDYKVIDLALILVLHPIVGIEVAVGQAALGDEVRDLAGDIRDFKFADPACATFAFKQPRPRRLDATTERRDQPETRNNDPTQHASPLSTRPVRTRTQSARET